jgi:hypothetical protein
MKDETLRKVVMLIESASDEEVRILIGAFNRRSKARMAMKRREILASLSIKDRVRMVNMKPKYLNGTGGTVVGFEKGKVKVRLDDDVDPRALRRFGWEPLCGPAGLMREEGP